MKQSIIDFGLISSIGSGKEETKSNLFSPNRCGLTPATLKNGTETYIGKVSIELELIPENLSNLQSRNNQLLLTVFKQIEASFITNSKELDPEKIGIVIGTSTSGISDVEQAFEYKSANEDFPEDYHYKKHEMGSPSEFLAKYLNCQGPSYTISCACSSGAKAIASASRLLSSGICDLVICGGVDTLCDLTLLGFDSLEVISSQQCLPFSKNRDGINIGEAGALFLMKNEPGAYNLLAYGESSDAHHHSAPDPEGKGAIKSMKEALDAAMLKEEDINYINLHGTGTIQNDAMEAKAVNKIFKSNPPCSSTKALTGHTLGAAGALEAAFSLLALEENQLPIHHWDNSRDPDMDQINLVAPETKTDLKNIMSNSYAFGGNNCSLILGKANGK